MPDCCTSSANPNANAASSAATKINRMAMQVCSRVLVDDETHGGRAVSCGEKSATPRFVDGRDPVAQVDAAAVA